MRRGTPPTPVPQRSAFVADWIPQDSPKVTRDYCPSCEPETDPIREYVQVQWCDDHRCSTWGKDDERVREMLDGASLHYTFNEAGGADNRAVCDFIHRPPKKVVI